MTDKDDAYWREKLTPEEYHVLRQKGTERAFTGEYWDATEVGTYTCRGCGETLFESESKFDAGCGWPSFDQAIPNTIIYVEDFSHNMRRIEVKCSKCDGHLGHVFNDGPRETTGKRYCINSAALSFKKE